MSLSQPTFDDVWKLIQETNASMRVMSQESDRKLAESSAAFRKEMQEMREMQQKMSDETD